MTKEHSNRIKELFITEHRRLSAFIRSRINSIDDAEDLLQDVYLQLLGNVNILDSIDNITGWLYTVVQHKIIDWYRRKRLQTISLDAGNDADLSLRDLLTEELSDTAMQVDQELLVEHLMQGIEQLPEKQKFVFIEQVLNDKTFRQMEEETGEPINTLIARKRYAIAFLRKQIKKFPGY